MNNDFNTNQNINAQVVNSLSRYNVNTMLAWGRICAVLSFLSFFIVPIICSIVGIILGSKLQVITDKRYGTGILVASIIGMFIGPIILICIAGASISAVMNGATDPSTMLII